MRPFDASGRELASNVAIEVTTPGFDAVPESRGGSIEGARPSGNSDYSHALTLLLERLARRNIVLTKVRLASAQTVKMSPEERILRMRTQ